MEDSLLKNVLFYNRLVMVGLLALGVIILGCYLFGKNGPVRRRIRLAWMKDHPLPPPQRTQLRALPMLPETAFGEPAANRQFDVHDLSAPADPPTRTGTVYAFHRPHSPGMRKPGGPPPERDN